MLGIVTARVRDALRVLGLVAAVALPFLDKAFHIDDPIALRLVANVRADPFDPFAGEISYHGWPESLFEVETNPPLLAYWLAPFAAAFGPSEIGLHAAMAPFLLLLAVSALSLGRRFTASPALALLFVMTSAGVVVSGNVMRDVPALALATAAAALSSRGLDAGRAGLVAAAQAVAGLALLTKYSSAVVPAVLALQACLRGRPRQAAWAALPAGMLGLWSAWSASRYGESHVLALLARPYGPGSAWRDNLVGLPVAAGSLCLLAPALLAAAWRRKEKALLAALAAVALASGLLTHLYLGGAEDAQLLLWSLSGCVLLVACSGEALRGAWPLSSRPTPAAADSIFLLAWLSAPLVFAAFFVPFQAVRHVLPALPPAVLLALRHLGRGPGPERGMRGLVRLLLALQVVTTALVAVADHDHAESYRDFARRGPERHAPAGGTLWFVGHWGWMHYAAEAGMRQLDARTPAPAPGDRVVIPWDVDKGPTLSLRPDLLQRLRPVDTVTFPGRVPVRVMNRSAGSGFYGLHSLPAPGHLPGVPFRFLQDVPVEIFHVHEVR